MNEITKIHLGRQAFTISVDAYHDLKTYLDAIKKQVDDQEVVEEIELRIVELLTERGVNADKVILPADVNYVKKQLGEPADFKEDREASASEDVTAGGRRLFRDIDNAILAGVASGLAQYFGIDILLVRILFIILLIVTVGWGVLLYILLWLLVPEAKTSSDRLQMAGKPVTVESLKEITEKADVPGAAQRANASLAEPINRLFRVVCKLIGVFLMLFGLSALFGLVAWETYFLSHGNTLAQDSVFPVGFRENLLVNLAAAVAALGTVFIIMFGIAIFKRRWPVRNWLTGVLAGLLFIGLAVCGALAADAYPNVRDRYNANLHTTTYSVQPFTTVNTDNANVFVDYEVSSKYAIALNYYDRPNLSEVKMSVQNGTLSIDTSHFDELRNCQALCLPANYALSITVYSPNALDLQSQNGPQMMPSKPIFPAPVIYKERMQ